MEPESAKGKYLLFLDSDQWVVSDRWLDCAYGVLVHHPQIGAVG